MTEAVSPVLDPHALALSELELAEKLIFEACRSEVAAVSVGAAHVMRAGGKRLRPLVLILVVRSCGYGGGERASRLGAAVELIHTATLVHDDVVDESDTRRGQDAVNTFFGNEASVLVGDYLVCRALRMIAEEPDLELMRAICDVIISMCEAEVLQITYRGDVENTFENYFRVIRNKTACLFSFTARAGAQVARAPAEVKEQFARFGLNLGIAFQIVDDILDLTGKQAELGKPTAADLREGKFTYPVLHAIRHVEEQNRESFLDRLQRAPTLTPQEVEEVVDMVQASGGIQAAYDCACGYADRALEALEGLDETPALQALRTVVHHVVERRA